MSWFLKWYRWISILSLDVVAGAVVSAAFFTRLFSIEIRPVGLIVLGLSVWIIYTADHLKDAYRLKREATTERHRFHQQNFNILLIIESILVIIVALLAFKMKWAVVSWGLMLAGLVLLYLLTSQFLFSLKEIFGWLFYCWGVFLPTISQLTSYESFFAQPEVVVFTILVLCNLLIFSIYEMEADSSDNHKSFALTFGRQNTGLVVKVLLGIVSGLLIWSYWALVPIHFFILTLMTAGLILITLFPDYFKIQDRYRYVGDIIFLFPGLIVLS